MTKSALTVACLGRGGICRAVADVPFAALASPATLAAVLRAAGWDLVAVADHAEVRCAECRSQAGAPSTG